MPKEIWLHGRGCECSQQCGDVPRYIMTDDGVDFDELPMPQEDNEVVQFIDQHDELYQITKIGK